MLLKMQPWERSYEATGHQGQEQPAEEVQATEDRGGATHVESVV